MGHDTCCVVNCRNTGRNNKNVKYYKFPTAQHKLMQRQKWIAAVKRVHSDGSLWSPKASDTICSAHFINNAKADEELSPSYVPTIFPPAYRSKVANEITVRARHERFMKRRILKLPLIKKKNVKKANEFGKDEYSNDNSLEIDMEIKPSQYEKQFCDQECEAFFFVESNQSSRTFVCNRYIYKDRHSICDVEIQTDIVEISETVKMCNRKKFKDAGCNAVENKAFKDKLVGSNFETQEPKTMHFTGIDCVKEDQQLLDLAGVTFGTFTFLLNRFNINPAENSKISRENRLLLFLTKMKTGMTFSALSVIFNMHRTTVAKMFYSSLRHLARATADYVYWPVKADIIKTMPECFCENYKDTRVIIDCTEFRVETPPRVDDRVFTYSHYKKSFTAKLLVGITPSGFISFKSNVAGGRKSDSQITMESGLINLLEDNDVVLADKGFPQFQNIIDERGSKVLLVMPPFLDKNSEFTEEETRETYKVAKCRIHVERAMQRIRTYLILSKITHNLFKYIDDIVHVICVLVNLQPPIIKKK